MLHSPTLIPYTLNTRIMGIDYGEKRIGLALSDTSWTIGNPYIILISKGIKKDIAAIEKIILEKLVVGFVIGIPRAKREGSTYALCQKILKFKTELQNATCKPASLYEETFSSKVSEKILSEAGIKKKKKLYIDKMSAAYILQSFLEWNKLQKN